MSGSNVLLLLGGNMGEPEHALERAERAIAERIGSVQARSRDHWTSPWGFTDDRLFLNRALAVRTKLDPARVMSACLAIEKEQGRVRPADGTMVSRVIDIDILAIEELVIDTSDLIVPHPRMQERRFALAPMADLWPLWRHPRLGRTVLELLDNLRG